MKLALALTLVSSAAPAAALSPTRHALAQHFADTRGPARSDMAKIRDAKAYAARLERAPERRLQPPSGGGPPPGGGPPGGGTGPESGGGTTACPAGGGICAAAALGDVGFLTVTAVNPQPGGVGNGGEDFEVGESIYGPFEAGFTSDQDNILSGFGCNGADKTGYVQEGIDTLTAESVVGASCGGPLPRYDEDGTYISLLDECGGHTAEYHFHERMSCTYDADAEGHSTQVGEATVEGSFLYGKFEGTGELPLLDACGGSWGVTPDSSGEIVYHYHVQDKPPFTFGCYGPNADGSMVTLAQCREFHDECGNGDTIDLEVSVNDVMGYADGQTIQYDPWCPCYDATGSNVGTEPLAFESIEGYGAAPDGWVGGTTDDTTDEEEEDAAPEEEEDAAPEEEEGNSPNLGDSAASSSGPAVAVLAAAAAAMML